MSTSLRSPGRLGTTSSTLDFGRILDPLDPPLPAGVKTESGLRTRDASDLRATLTPHLRDYGITRVAHLTGFDYVGLPVHMAVKPQGRTLSSGSGKGPTPDASWVSAVMECAEQSVWESLRFDAVEASSAAMERLGVEVADGDQLAQMKGAIWSDRVPIRWIPGWDIVGGREVYVPESLVNVSLWGEPEFKLFVSGSNGLASGAHILESILSGLQEVVERDGVGWATTVGAAHVDGLPLLRDCAAPLAERIERSGLQLEVVDGQNDLGVPTVIAYLHDVVGGTTGSFKGAGAGVSNRTALVRAVTEAAQARCLIVAGARDDIFETQRASATTAPQRALTLPTDVLVEGTDHGTGDVMRDLTWMVDKVVAAGFPQVIVFRHTLPGDPVQVARVIVPGLEGYQFGFAARGPRGRRWAAETSERNSA